MNKILFLFLFVILTSCKVGRFIVYNFADIRDYKKFPKREIQNTSNTFFQYEKAEEFTNLDSVLTDFDQFVEEHKTVAFLVIHNDTIKYEKYYNNYNDSSIVTSFSMAKSFTSMLIGCVIEDQFITSVDEPITKYIPELEDKGFEDVTIEHLLQMTSGIAFNESYFNPFGHAASFYYGRNLRKEISKLKMEGTPGEAFNYVSGDTQLLGLILSRALKNKTISAYFQEKIWTPLGMEYDASWSMDRKKDGLEKPFCCVNARARDFAKLGRLYLNEGNWNGQQVVPKEWVKKSTEYTNENGSYQGYQYQWWITNQSGDFMAQGILGQYIFVCPSKNLVIVRLGKNYGNTSWIKIFEKIKMMY